MLQLYAVFAARKCQGFNQFLLVDLLIPLHTACLLLFLYMPVGPQVSLNQDGLCEDKTCKS